MISLRYRAPFEDAWTYSSFDGPDEAQALGCLIAALTRLDFDIQQTDRHGDFFNLGDLEDEE